MVTGQPPGEVSYGGPPEGAPAGERRHLKIAALLVTVGLLAAVFGALCLPGPEEPEAPTVPLGDRERPLAEVSDRVFDARLLWNIPLTRRDSQGHVTADSAAMPSDVVLVNGRIFVLDTNNGRLLEISEPSRSVLRLVEVQGDVALDIPMAITAHEGSLYVANSGAGNVVVVDLEGTLQRVITPELPPAGRPLRPVGIAVAPSGELYLSDPDNQRVLRLDADGRLLKVLGSGQRESGEYGFNAPGALSLDALGNLYVVDMLNYSVKKYSPGGEFLLAVGEAGDTEGAFSRPKAVAVDDLGRIFVSDTILAAIQAFAADGAYAGFIGRSDPRDKRSASLFQAPHGVKVVGDTLYVTDRFAGLFAFGLGTPAASRIP